MKVIKKVMDRLWIWIYHWKVVWQLRILLSREFDWQVEKSCQGNIELQKLLSYTLLKLTSVFTVVVSLRQRRALNSFSCDLDFWGHKYEIKIKRIGGEVSTKEIDFRSILRQEYYHLKWVNTVLQSQQGYKAQLFPIIGVQGVNLWCEKALSGMHYTSEVVS